MKISQISEYSLPAEGGLPPLQSMIYEEIMRRPDEVFEYQGEELLRVFPRLKRSALNWSLWLLAKEGHIGKMRLRVNGKLTTVYGAHEAIDALKDRMHIGAGSAVEEYEEEEPEQEPEDEATNEDEDAA